MTRELALGGKRFAASFSGGKDSTLAIYRAIKAGGRLDGLITTVNKERDGSYAHCITRDQVARLASLLGGSMQLLETDDDHYRQDFVDCLRSSREDGVEAAVFGDIDIQGHREWVESVCSEARIEAVFPLWQEDRRQVVEEFLRLGFNAVIKVVNLAYLDTSYLGRTLDDGLLREFQQRGIDICGENGEYHTLVVDGPLFRKPLAYEVDRVITENGYGILLLK